MGFFKWFKAKPVIEPYEDIQPTCEPLAPEPLPQVQYQPVELQANGTLKPNYTITKPRDSERSKWMDLSHLYPSVYNFGHLFPTKKTQHIYVFNLSTQEFKLSRPPLLGDITIPGVKEGEEYALAFSLPQPLPVPRTHFDEGSVDLIWEDARRIATDIVNPSNIGINPKDITPDMYSPSLGTDLTQMGVFWSFHSKPTKTEIKVYRKRMEARYRDLLDQIWTLYTSGEPVPKGEITPAHHAAAEYFQQDLPWHPRCPRPKTQEKP